MLGSHPYIIEYNRLFGNIGIQGLQRQIDEEIVRYLAERLRRDDPDPPLSQVEAG